MNNHLDKFLADTGAGVSVCGVETARRWNLLDRMSDTKVSHVQHHRQDPPQRKGPEEIMRRT